MLARSLACSLSLPALAALFALASPACLDASRPGSTADSVGGDTATGDVALGDTGPSCVGVVCDDGDPCTFDFCDPATGLCRHDGTPAGADVAARPNPECSDDGGCDDGDPCTADACVLWDVCQPTLGGSCQHEPIAGCEKSCALAPCSDGLRCTEDVCRSDGTCEFRPLYGCVEMCSGAGAVATADVPFDGTIGAVKVGGAIVEHGPPACDDGPLCGCVAGVAVADATGRLGLAGDGVEGPWGCRSTGCGVAVWRCAPAERGREYWLVGEKVPRAFGAEAPAGDVPGVPAPPPQVDLVVSDYCLKTTPKGLAGLYRGQVEPMGDAPPRYAELTIAATNPVTLTFAVSCPGCSTAPSEPWQIDGLRVTDGRLSFTARRPAVTGSASEAFELVLFPGRDTLTGSYRKVGAPALDGRVTLTLAADAVVPL